MADTFFRNLVHIVERDSKLIFYLHDNGIMKANYCSSLIVTTSTIYEGIESNCFSLMRPKHMLGNLFIVKYSHYYGQR